MRHEIVVCQLRGLFPGKCSRTRESDADRFLACAIGRALRLRYTVSALFQQPARPILWIDFRPLRQLLWAPGKGSSNAQGGNFVGASQFAKIHLVRTLILG